VLIENGGICPTPFQEKQEWLKLVSTVAFLRGQQGDLPPVRDDINGSKPKGKQTPAVSSSEPDTATRAPILSSSMSREPTHVTSLHITETTALQLSQALPSLAANASPTSQQRDMTMAPEPPQSVVLASSSSHNEGTLVSLLLHWAPEINADVHPHPGPAAPSFQDDVRSPRFPSHCSHSQDQFR